MPIGGVASERVCACSLRSRLVLYSAPRKPLVPTKNIIIYCKEITVVVCMGHVKPLQVKVAKT